MLQGVNKNETTIKFRHCLFLSKLTNSTGDLPHNAVHAVTLHKLIENMLCFSAKSKLKAGSQNISVYETD